MSRVEYSSTGKRNILIYSSARKSHISHFSLTRIVVKQLFFYSRFMWARRHGRYIDNVIIN